MKKHLLYLLILPILFLAACGKDDDQPEPTHEVGTWELEGFLLSNLPNGFTGYEGLQLGLSDLNFGGVSYDSYTLDLNIDGSYSIEIEVGLLDDEDTGTWTLDGDELILDSDEFGEQAWDVVENEDDDLWLSQTSNFSLFHDSVTQAQLDTLTDEEINQLLNSVTLDLIFAFERKSN